MLKLTAFNDQYPFREVMVAFRWTSSHPTAVFPRILRRQFPEGDGKATGIGGILEGNPPINAACLAFFRLNEDACGCSVLFIKVLGLRLKTMSVRALELNLSTFISNI